MFSANKEGTHEFREAFYEPVNRCMPMSFPSGEYSAAGLNIAEVNNIGHGGLRTRGEGLGRGLYGKFMPEWSIDTVGIVLC